MAQDQEHFALDWIKSDLLETLDSARASLEAAVEGEGDSVALRGCLTSLHQVHGTLVMLELAGVTLLADHLEQLAQGLVSNKVGDLESAAQVLMQGILEIPAYLDELQGGLPDSERPVIPLVNEVRAMLGKELLEAPAPSILESESSEESLARFEAIDGTAKARKIRSAYQQVLLSVLKGEDRAKSVTTLNKIAHGLERICAGTPHASHWQAFGEFVRSLSNKTGPLEPGGVKLLRRVDAELRDLAAYGSEALRQPVSRELIEQLLEAAEEREHASELMEGLRAAVSRPATDSLAISGRQALASAAGALRDELATVKDALDLYVRSESSDLSGLSEAIVNMQQIGNTLSLLGFQSSRETIFDQAEVLEEALRKEELDDATAFAIASAVVQVDENLASLTEGGTTEVERITTDAQKAVAIESRNGLEIVKQAVVDYVSGEFDVNLLVGSEHRLDAMSSALDVIPLPRAARLLSECRRYMSEVLLNDQTPNWEQLDHYADALSGIDYYLERVSQDGRSTGNDVLALVEQSLAQLDFGVDAAADSTESVETSLEGIPEEAAAEPVDDIVPDLVIRAAQQSANVSADAGKIHGVEADNTDPDVVAFKVEPISLDDFDLDTVGEPDDVQVARAQNDEVSDAADLPVEPPEAVAATSDDSAEQVAAAAVLSAGAALVAAQGFSVEDSFDVDADIAEIFVEECMEVIETIDQYLPQWQQDLSQAEALAELRRGYHTIKGSGRMVGANVVGEMAWSVENLLNRIIDNTIPANSDLQELVARSRALLPTLIADYEEQRSPDVGPVALLMEHADILASGGELPQVEAVAVADVPAVDIPEVDIPALDSPVESDTAQDQAAQESLRLFAEEARDHVAALHAALGSEPFALREDSMTALHTLVGNASISGAEDAHAVAAAMYGVGVEYRQHNVGTQTSSLVLDFFSRGTDLLADLLEHHSLGMDRADATSDSESVVAESDTVLAQIRDNAKRFDLLALDGVQTLFEAEEFLQSWQSGSIDLDVAAQLTNTLQQLSMRAVEVEQENMSSLASALHGAHTRLQGLELSASDCELLQLAHEKLLVAMDNLASDQLVPDLSDAVAAANNAGTTPEAPEDVIEDTVVELPVLAPVVELPSPASAAAEPMALSESEESESEVDPEIVAIFFEEADEILEELDESVHAWTSERENRLHLENVLRGLHTLKGGARLAGMSGVGDTTHQYESYVIEAQSQKGSLSDDFFTELQLRQDSLVAQVDAARSGEEMVVSTSDELEASQDFDLEESQSDNFDLGDLELDKSDLAAAERSDSAQDVARADLTAVPNAAGVERQISEPARAATEVEVPNAEQVASAASAEQRSVDMADTRSPQEVVRVGASLLEELVNLAGENSIVRARIEQGLADFAGALEEMDTTIGRVRDQLRRLEIETETQVLYRQESGPINEDFDPLEMDRYSQVQQLSRSLTESASDILDLKETLQYRAREAETLLLQQARINTELQEGLMRTRMVPFSRLLPRLRRIVRQIASETGKAVEFSAYNVEGELDRNLLERMVPPLEHMLRNAVDHGIETAEARRAYGKPDVGKIDLRLSREGGDIMIEISDDGAGVDVETVRAKAVERGLMQEDSQLRDEEILQFILAPGFSTAKSVTQISGRGVGMDVVHSEVKQLGGSVNIHSNPGRGTRFVLRLPFTVSVNRALMVSVGEDLYAIPLNTIEGIVLLGPQELERLYAADAQPFEYAGVHYHVRYLGNFLGREFRGLNNQTSSPVVLVRSGDQAIAVHVDHVQGSREIVVKSLGPQFAGLGGISGATILGDGSVVVILDLLALIRAQAETAQDQVPRVRKNRSRTKCVMVVDDSVTVRKVTTRLLERQGMDVLVAKDGVEAVAMLQERRPDILLLDIEMPRMDGFEVARQVRRDDDIQELPIVMISSRTGEKHQDRAAELGVNRFLGKPFQEAELLSTIEDLVN